MRNILFFVVDWNHDGQVELTMSFRVLCNFAIDQHLRMSTHVLPRSFTPWMGIWKAGCKWDQLRCGPGGFHDEPTQVDRYKSHAQCSCAIALVWAPVLPNARWPFHRIEPQDLDPGT